MHATLAPAGATSSSKVVKQFRTSGSSAPETSKQRTSSGSESTLGSEAAGVPITPAPARDKAKGKSKHPSHAFVQRINMAASCNDAASACAAYDDMLAAGLMPSAQVFNTLLHLCVGGWAWESYARQVALQQWQQHTTSSGSASSSSTSGGSGDSSSSSSSAGSSDGGGGGDCGVRGAAAAAASGGIGGSGALRGDDPDGLLLCHIGQETGERGGPDADGGRRGASAAAGQPAAPPLSLAELLVRADQVQRHMVEAGVAPDEATYAHLARAAAIRLDSQAALDITRRVLEASGGGGVSMNGRRALVPRLRDFQPALLVYALEGDAQGALQVATTLAELDIDLTESEWALLLEAVARGGSYEQLAGLLLRMRDELNQLQPSTLSLVRRFMASDRAAGAFVAGAPLAGAGARWDVREVVVDAQGSCPEAGEALRVVDLDEGQWRVFGGAIAELAAKQEKRQDAFAKFMTWHARNGPFDVLIDAANVALFGQNREGGGFRMQQVVAMYKAVQRQHPGAKILLVMHARRAADVQASDPHHAAWLERLRAARRFYSTPPGSNDDWYWLWASVAARSRGLLVSNDELRDHIWALLRPRHFLKWKERHIARYTFTGDEYLTPVLSYPSPYTPCCQQLSNGTWMLPGTDGRWLCARPVQ